MKQLRKVMAVIFAVVLALTMTVTASAAEKTGKKITLTTSNVETLTGEFAAYRILDFDISGTAVNYKINEDFKDFFENKGCYDAKSAYDYIVNNAEDMNAIRTEFKEYVNGKKLSNSKVDGEISGNKVEFANAKHGYYVIIPSNELYAINLVNLSDDAANGYVKIVKPTPDKTAQDADKAWKEAISASVGTIVPFKVVSVIPDITDETQDYYFIMKDTMTKGLTYVDGTLSVTVAGTPVNVTPTVSTDKRTLTVSIPLVDLDAEPAIDYRDDIGKDIVIEYSAKVGADAVTVDPANNADLSYGNNPEFDGEGNNSPDNPDVVPVYNHELTIENVDKSVPENHIGGGKFTVTGPDGETVELVKEEDGTYRPFISGEDDDGNKVTEITLPDTGTVVIKGFDSGEYTVTQTTPPEGYGDPDQNPISVTFEEDSNNDETAKFVNGVFTGLPETGGMGTVIFTVVGLALIAAVAGSFVISRKKKNS